MSGLSTDLLGPKGLAVQFNYSFHNLKKTSSSHFVFYIHFLHLQTSFFFIFLCQRRLLLCTGIPHSSSENCSLNLLCLHCCFCIDELYSTRTTSVTGCLKLNSGILSNMFNAKNMSFKKFFTICKSLQGVKVTVNHCEMWFRIFKLL